jgi:ribulose-phosphate 3-epimerase
MKILPAVLTTDTQEFHERLCFPTLRDKATFHVDILDGSMFGETCWADPKVVGSWNHLPPIELHLMVQNPLPHIEAWHAHVPSFQRAIVHSEIARPVGAILERLEAMGLDRTLALNPETPVETIEKYLNLISAAQIMGIHPGKSGQTFLGEPILAKIRRAHSLFPSLTLSVDGGVLQKNAQMLMAAGANCLVANSALWNSSDPIAAYTSLLVY